MKNNFPVLEFINVSEGQTKAVGSKINTDKGRVIIIESNQSHLVKICHSFGKEYCAGCIFNDTCPASQAKL